MNLGDLPAALVSPAKIVYIAYIILLGLKVLSAPPAWLFFVISVLFLAIEILHNDYFRIRLNLRAHNKKAGIL